MAELVARRQARLQLTSTPVETREDALPAPAADVKEQGGPIMTKIGDVEGSDASRLRAAAAAPAIKGEEAKEPRLNRKRHCE